MIFQAMDSTYFGPTNHRCSRIRVRASAGTMWFDWDPALNPEQNHKEAVKAFMRAKGWDERNVAAGGGAPNNGDMNYWVMVPA